MRRPIATLAVAAIYGCLVCALVGLGQPLQPQPVPQLVVPARIDHIVDGDTLDATVMIRVRVRLLECWAPEANTPAGERSTAHLVAIAEGRDGWLTVPLEGDRGLQSLFSFGRVLAYVATDAGDVSAAQRAAGHATRLKEE